MQLRISLGLCFVASAFASLPDGRPHGNVPPINSIPLPDYSFGFGELPVVSRNGTVLPPYNTIYYFDQLIDHANPSLGTFKQRYWHTYEFYEPGMGPYRLHDAWGGQRRGWACYCLFNSIYLMPKPPLPSIAYSGYLSNTTINGLIAQQESGAVVLLEHRFFGLSNPYPSLTGKNFKVHTVQQSLDDIEYFAKHVNLPMPNGNQLTPDKAPWIITGGSYPGALASYMLVNKPGLFAAGYASSAPVRVMENFWVYFEPIRKNMPQNCSVDVAAVIAHFDDVFSGTNTTAMQALKTQFGMGAITHNDDFLGAFRNDLWGWQNLQPTTGPGAPFYRFCDALEVKNGVKAGASGWGLQNALDSWARYWKSELSSMCGGLTAEQCFGSYNLGTPDTSVNQVWRSWNWILCNEFGFSQSGPPRTANIPAIVSHLVVPQYDIRQCVDMYPDVFTTATAPNFTLNTQRTNQKYAGWNVKAQNLFFSNARRDTWKEGSVSAEAVNVQSTDSMPIYLSEGFHASDLLVRFAAVDSTVASAQRTGLAAIKRWLQNWKATI